MTLDDFNKLTSSIFSIFSILAITASGIFALCEYQGHKESVRQENSLKLVAEHSGKESMERQLKVSRLWEDNFDSMIDTVTPSKNQQKSYAEFFDTQLKNNPVNNDIDFLLDFYERAAICASYEICSSEVIHKFLDDHASAFIIKVHPYVCNMRSKWKDDTLWEVSQTFFAPTSIGGMCL